MHITAENSAISDSAWLSRSELRMFDSVGVGVKVSRHAMVYGSENITIGDNVRIDAQAVLLASGGFITLGSHIHIAAQAILSGGGVITLEDFCMVSFGAKLISASDDLSGLHLVGPVIDSDLLQVKRSPINMRCLSVVLAAGTVLPGVTLNEGTVLAAHGMLSQRTTEGWYFYGGVPAVKMKQRSTECLQAAQVWRERWNERKSKAD